MEKKILVPVTLQKDARLGDLDVDVELEVSCNLSHETAPPASATPAPAEPPAWASPVRPLVTDSPAAEVGPEAEEQTMAFDTSKASHAVKDALAPAAGKSLPVTKPAPKAAASKAAAKGKPVPDAKGKPSSKTKIDNVLDELLKKKSKK